MRATFGQLSAFCTLGLLATGGCYSYPYHYAPYGYAPYPMINTPASTPYLPPATLSPGTTLGTPTPILTQPGAGQSYPTPATPNWEPNNDAPLYRPGQNGTSGSSQGVPDPMDIPGFNSTSAPSATGPTGSKPAAAPAQTPFSPFGDEMGQSNPVELTPIESGSQMEVSQASDPFVSPVPYRPASSTRTVGDESTSGLTPTMRSQPNPYDYDRESFAWLRGVVDYDEQDHSWNIIYSLTPDETDPYGGSITLADSEQLDALQNGDVVLIEGRLDGSQTDRSGKAKYHVDKVFALQPKQ